MSQMLTIGAHEHGKIYVFAINQPVGDIKSSLAKMPKADLARALLGLPHLDTASAELFPVSDLAGVGLSAYLSEGYAVPEEDLTEDAGKLDALDGYVLLLFSDSFGGKEHEITLGPDVTLIGTYGEFEPNNRPRSLSAKSAQMYTGAAKPEVLAPKSKGLGSSIVALALVVLVLALLWWVL